MPFFTLVEQTFKGVHIIITPGSDWESVFGERDHMKRPIKSQDQRGENVPLPKSMRLLWFCLHRDFSLAGLTPFGVYCNCVLAGGKLVCVQSGD